MTQRFLTKAFAAAALLALAGCGGSSSSSDDAVTVEGDVPIAYAKRANTMMINPTNGAPSAPGGDLIIRPKSSASADEINVTKQFTQGQGDVTGPEPSYDGKKIVFAMRCPTANTSKIGDEPACTGRWNIWEYDTTQGGLAKGTFRRLTASTESDDVDPAYLPAGKGFVFTSNRQTTSKHKQGLGKTYYALDEYERERVFNLHTMDAEGQAITQISVNQSHDRSPVVRPNGDIMFSRWDHVGGRNHFKIFRVKPDGTDLFVLYGAHSEGNSFLHPRDMDPKGLFAGQVTSDLMPLSRTHEGGGLVRIDVANYSEQNTPANKDVPAEGGQMQMTDQALNLGQGLSSYGRVSSPFPLWDGSDRVLVSFTPCQVRRGEQVVACATLTAAERTRLENEDRPVAEVEADELQDDVRPTYAVYMFDARRQTMLPVASPPTGFMYLKPVALMKRAEPHATAPTAVDATLAAAGMGLLEVRSVYDTDGLGRMGDPVLVAADLPAGCTAAIPKTTPTEPKDTRAQVADLKRMKDPADPAYRCSPARFVRVVRAIAPPQGMSGMRSAIGETEFEMQQVLGYAPIEPDGSFKLQVPADVPIAVAVVDAQGRAFQTHTNWIQVRPGERRTCDGCHSPRRGGSLNAGAVANHVPAALLPAMANAHESGETMAATRTRLDPAALQLAADLMTRDIWADTSKAGVVAHPTIAVKYTGNANPADDLATATPVDGIVNYPEHIQPLWTRNRGANTCTTCHADPAKLDLRANIAGSGRLVSYDELLIGDPVLDKDGRPVTTVREGVPMVETGPALVDTAASEGEALGLARKSRLAEILWGQSLMAGSGARTAHPAPPAGAPDHATLMNAAEKRLLAEWMDLGGKYYNDPFDADNGVRQLHGVSEEVFAQKVMPILQKRCASCHQAVGSTATGKPTGSSFRNNRFVLTGDAEGDFNVTLTMVNNACTPAQSLLLAKPSGVPHPGGAVGVTKPVLAPGSADFNTISKWIAGGC